MEPLDSLEREDMQSELLRLAKKSKAKRKLIFTGVFFVLVLVAVVASWLSGRSQAKKNAQQEIAQLRAELQEQHDQIQELKNSPIVVNPVAPTINLEILHSEINAIGELATTEYLFTDAAKYSDSKQIKNWSIPLTEKSFILKWSGNIKAGVDVAQVTIEVDESAKKIIVTVPSAKILSYTIDSDSVEILDESNNILNKITVDDKVKFDAKTESAMKQRAIENGLLEKAQKNAEAILKCLILSDHAVTDAYTIVFIVK